MVRDKLTMRYVGRITDWNDDRGFGFVTPNGGGDRAFVHIHAFERRSSRPTSGQLISYEPQKDERGRLKATAIRAVVLQPERNQPSRKSVLRKPIAVVFFAVLAAGWLLGKVPPVVLLAYAALSIVAFAMYGMDKSAARNNRWRTPESNLHIVALLGGWPGALLAQDVFHHKSKKTEFQSVFWTTVGLNCMALIWLLASRKTNTVQTMLDALMGS